MTEKGVQTWTRETWHTWLPGWIPICLSILCAAIWVGRYQKTIDNCVEAIKNLQTDVAQVKSDVSETKGYLKGMREQQFQNDPPPADPAKNGRTSR